MKYLMIVSSMLILFGCASTTYIRTLPSAAKIYEGDVLKGFTPYMHWDREEGNASRTFILYKEGYKDKIITIKKTDFNPMRIIGPPVLAWPWLYDYPYEYVFELEKSGQPIAEKTLQSVPTYPNLETQPKMSDPSGYVQKLRELKKIKEEGLITDKEYEQKRKAIIDGM
ncbi:MAG: hypothetical protein Q8O28_04130 [Smithellaceae bacterium]|nr:hypothetical protein [Smithellaceae bacterium]